MSANNWKNNAALIAAWLSMSKDNGDIYRQFLVNPIIHGLLMSNSWRSAASPLHSALAAWLKAHGETARAKRSRGQWYGEWQRTTVHPLGILDLGCGEAYRGRWLSKTDVAYVGVDVSDGLLSKAAPQDRFTCVQADLDGEAPLKGVWNERLPPDWVFAITLFDHLTNPDRLLSDLASMYGPGHRGKMLVVTCNPAFYGKAANNDQPTQVRIATVGERGGDVMVYLRSRQEMRRLFRDAGFHVLDEASPRLPSQFANLRDFDASGFNLAYPPLNFWLLGMHSTQRYPVEQIQLTEWLAELTSQPSRVDATKALLSDLIPHVRKLAWRKLRAENVVIERHNVGGRLFVVREGLFQSEVTRGGKVRGEGATTRGEWLFQPGDIFGELEISRDLSEPEWLYPASILTRKEGPNNHAKALEVPWHVTRELMTPGRQLGNPFLTLLRRKVLETLLRFDPSLLDEKIRQSKEIERLLSRQGTSPDMYKLEGRLVVIVASLIAQGLEYERERSPQLGHQGTIVLISSIRRAIAELLGEKDVNRLDANRFNLAIRFLAGAGVIRRARPVVSDSAKGASQNVQLDVERRKEASKRLRSALEQRSWVRKLNSDQKRVFVKLIGLQADSFFLVDDEIALRRCVLEPSLSLFDDLASRHRLFLPQPLDVERASADDLELAIIESLALRFETEYWRIDSLGWQITGDP